MIIALDFDDTYTRDPALWDRFIAHARERGHTIIVATMRNEEYEGAEVKNTLGSLVDDIVFTDRKIKAPIVYAAGYQPHIWIDDHPNWIF